MEQRIRETDFTKALWVPLLWLLLSSIRDRLTPERLVEVEAFQASPTFRFLFMALFVLSIFILWHRRIPWQQFLHHNLWIVALFGLMGLSILWADYPWVSLKRFVKTLGVLFMILIILTERDPFDAFSAVIRRFCYLTIPLSTFLILLVPSYGRRILADGTVYWVGVTGHKNNMALIVLIGAMYFTWLLFCQTQGRKKTSHVIMLLMSLFLLAACGSMTSLFSFFAVIVSLLLIRVGRVGARHAGIIIAYVLSISILGYFLLDNLIVRQPIALAVVELFGRDLTFTGRMDLWQDVWALAIQQPVLGHGFGGFWVGLRAEDLWLHHEWKPVDSHNGYLDIFAEMGILGVVLAGIIIVRTYKRITHALITDFEFARLRMMIFIMVLVHNLNETSLCSLNHPYWLLFLFTAVSGPRDWAIEDGSLKTEDSVEGNDPMREVKALG